MELVEHLAKIQLAARSIGRVNALADSEVAALLEKRTAAGLGPVARGAKSAPAPAPASTPLQPAPPAASPSLDVATLERIVREELARLTGRAG
jgi:hypothetical protein